MRDFRTRESAGENEGKMKGKKQLEISCVAGGGRKRVLSQVCLIWRKRVLAIGPSSSVASLRFLAHPLRATAPNPL